jgi:hypothetical protein
MPPCWTRTQLSGCLHYPTCGSGGEPEHLQPQRATWSHGPDGWRGGAGQYALNGQYLMSSVTPQALTRTVQDFRSQAAGAVVLENGAVAFDLAQSKYSISGEYNQSSVGGANVKVVFRKPPDRNKRRGPEIVDREAS